MKTRRFDFNYKPLQLNVCLSVEGSVPGTQSYDADSDTFTPDYTLTPLTLQPVVGRLDKDDVLLAGNVNQYLANIKWYEIVDDAQSLISTSDTDYEITQSGDNAGRLKIKKNAKPQIPLNLLFYAEYVDSRTSQVSVIRQSYQIRCKNSTQYIPLLVLDAAEQTIYNPLTDPDTQTVTASLRLGAEECPTEKRSFVWEKYRDDNTWSEVGTDETLDYDVAVASDGASCTVNRSLMGTELYLRCRAKYNIGGDPDSAELNDNSPQATVAFVRRIPKFEFDMAGTPTNIPAGLMAISPEAKIWDTNGDISDPERELLLLWYVATNKTGALSYDLIAHGMTPSLSTAKMSDTLGAVYGLDVKDVGPACAWEGSGGVVFVDDADNVILIK